jgi:ribosomal protein S18 acetylase RimI-like enzyme
MSVCLNAKMYAGNKLLKESLKIFSARPIKAEIKKDNKASLCLFKKNGFKKMFEEDNNIIFIL